MERNEMSGRTAAGNTRVRSLLSGMNAVTPLSCLFLPPATSVPPGADDALISTFSSAGTGADDIGRLVLQSKGLPA